VRVLVTGAEGFVGRHLVPRLRDDGHEVFATDRDLDVTDAAVVAKRVAELDPDAIVHLAALSSVAASWREPELTFRVNFLGSRSVLQAAAATTGVRVLWIGSADEYGSATPGSPAFTEASPLRPGSPYARCKAAADVLGATYADAGLDLVRIRPFNHAGPGQSPDFVLASFAKQVAEIEGGRREPVLRVGNLDSVRDFLDIEDVIEAYARLIDRSVPAGVYNVASGIGARIGDHLETLIALASTKPEVEVDPERLRPADFSVGDATRLRQATGWQPTIPMADTLERVLGYWRDRVSDA
jgi:GDP-4-dehydro-6-deoxy-D-mannose reductase